MIWSARREVWKQQQEDAREGGDIDYARVIHSASFRRLQGKTQILNIGDSDFYRTRLTHSLEVAQIAAGISRQLAKTFPNHAGNPYLPDRAMIQAIGCAHDLGHPPFGHGGEIALNYCMRPARSVKRGGFEGNGQTLRILSRLEKFSRDAGANLCRRTLLGVLKYPITYSEALNPDIIPSLMDGLTTIEIINDKTSKPPKCYMDSERDVVDWILDPLSNEDKDEFTRHDYIKKSHNKTLHKSLDCSIMDIADDIAYGVHDLEDSIALGLVSEHRFRDLVVEEKCASFLNSLKDKYPSEGENHIYDHMISGLFGDSGDRKRFIGRLVHHFMTAVELVEKVEFQEPLLRFRAEMKSGPREFLDELQKIIVVEVIKSPRVQHLEFKGQGMVVSVFEALQSDPKRLLPPEYWKRYDKNAGDIRVICDFVAGMTDLYMLKTYERLFSPRMGSIFDNL